MSSKLTNAENDANQNFWYQPVGNAVSGCSKNAPPAVVSPDKTHWIEIVLHDKNGNPVAGQEYEIRLPDGTALTGTLDERGVARVEGIDPGNCRITFPSLDKTVWNRK